MKHVRSTRSVLMNGMPLFRPFVSHVGLSRKQMLSCLSANLLLNHISSVFHQQGDCGLTRLGISSTS